GTLSVLHRAAEGVVSYDIAEFVDDLLWLLVIELRRIRADHSTNVARELDRRALHADTNAEVGDLLFARIADRTQLAFHAACAETGADQNAVDLGQLAVVPLVFQRFRIDVDDAHLDVVGDAAVDQRLIE